METLDAATRLTALERMAGEHFDVLVIGGGITGAGVALDATARGYRVALVEKADFASGTSSKSTKLLHGGIRYLPQFDFALVREALIERGLLIQNAPFLAAPLAFLLPLYDDAKRPVGIPIMPPKGIGLGPLLDIGLWMYDLMAGRRNVKRHKRISAAEALRLAPTLRGAGLKEAFLYYDAQTNDSRLTMTVLKTAAQLGAVIANYAEVTGFTRTDGRLSGAEVRDLTTGRQVTVAARHVVNAAGVFAEEVTALTGDESKVSVAPSKGVHLVVPRERVRLGDTAVVLPETDDNRILFVIPWESRAVIGTTDTGTGDLDHPRAQPDDVEYLMRHVNRYMDVNLTTDDILNTYAGYRPLVKSRGNHTSDLSRTHVVVEESNGMVTIVGGKLTTYRRMAQDTVDVIARRDSLPRNHPTQRLPLTGAIDWRHTQSTIEARARGFELSDDTIQHLCFDFGGNALAILDLIEQDQTLRQRLVANLPYVRAEVVYISRQEMAITLDDVLSRRTRLSLEDRDRATDVAEEVARLMGTAQGWSTEQIRAAVEQYIAQSRQQALPQTTSRLVAMPPPA